MNLKMGDIINIDTKKIFVVTGCLGFLGKHLTRYLLKNGNVVFGIDKVTYVSDTKMLEYFKSYGDHFEFIKKDICDLEMLPKCNYLINAAAESHVTNSIKDSIPFVETNVVGTQNLLNLLVGTDIRAIFLSTDETYGDIEEGSYNEESLLSPSNPYSASKSAGDMLIKAWARTHDVKYNILRPTNMYGPQQFPEKLIPLSVKNLILGNKIKLHNRGEPVRVWLHVNDVVDAIQCLVDNWEDNQVYNCSSHIELKNWEVVARIIGYYLDQNYEFDSGYAKDYHIAQIKDYLDLSYNRKGQDVRYSLDDSKLRNLGWKSKRDFDVSLKSIVRNDPIWWTYQLER